MERVALVTGGTRGIGEAISIALKDAGFKAVANYGGNDANAKAFSERTGIPAYKWDVSHLGSCQEGVAKVEADVGPISVLVNNAGITRDTPLHKMTEEMWDDVVRTNLSSCFYMCRSVVDGMRTRNWGRIVNISSLNGQQGQFGQTNYSAAKAGILGFTKALALESASKGITVNAICPGYTDTEMVRAVPPDILKKLIAKIPVGRLCTGAEIARAVMFLVDEGAGFITGSTMSVNGGQYFV